LKKQLDSMINATVNEVDYDSLAEDEGERV
jgi:hypothetical protein